MKTTVNVLISILAFIVGFTIGWTYVLIWSYTLFKLQLLLTALFSGILIVIFLSLFSEDEDWDNKSPYGWEYEKED
jgi:magnesium-transporting ATPase (P-type)